MRVYLLEVTFPPPEVDNLEQQVVRDDELHWGNLIGYLQRLQDAGVIDGWTMREANVRTAPSLLNDLVHSYDDDLDAIESGYEDSNGGGGDDPGYRNAMQDAGRGALLR